MPFTALGMVLRGSGGLGRSETDELGTGERERCGDEHGAHSFESIRKRAWTLPSCAANVVVELAAGGTATRDADDADQDEDDDDRELQTRRPKLFFREA